MTFIQYGWEYAENMLRMVFLEYVFAMIILAFNNYSVCAKRASIYNHFIVCNNNEYCFIQQISKSSIISKSTLFSNISNTAAYALCSLWSDEIKIHWRLNFCHQLELLRISFLIQIISAYQIFGGIQLLIDLVKNNT